MKKLAATTAGSRTWGPFQVTWTPDATSPKLTVTVSVSGSTLDIRVFTPDSGTQKFAGSNGTYTFSGTVIAGFDSGGMSGRLDGDLDFNSPTFGHQIFEGTIGVW